MTIPSCVSFFLCFCVWWNWFGLTFSRCLCGFLQYRLKCLNRQTVLHAAQSARSFYQQTSCHVRLPLPHSSQMVGAEISPVYTSGSRQCVSLQLSSLCSQRFEWRMEDCLGFTSRTNSLTNIERSSFAGKLVLVLDILIFKSEILFFDDFIFQCTSFTSKTHLSSKIEVFPKWASFFGSHSRKDPRYTWVGSVWDSISSLDTEWRCGCGDFVLGIQNL